MVRDADLPCTRKRYYGVRFVAGEGRRSAEQVQRRASWREAHVLDPLADGVDVRPLASGLEGVPYEVRLRAELFHGGQRRLGDE